MYRTKTYIAGDWTGDSDAIEQLYKWNQGDKWKLHFIDAHKNKQCYDSSKPCTIKDSLLFRLNISKTFILIVGNDTDNTRKGSCAYQICENKTINYLDGTYICTVKGKTYSTESFIDYECRKAYEAYCRGEMKIIVLYNAAVKNSNKCPKILRGIGTHVEMKSYNPIYQTFIYDYNKVRKAIEE